MRIPARLLLRGLHLGVVLLIAVGALGATEIDIDATWIAAHGAPPYLLTEAGAQYVLEQDVTADGTAFAIQADQVTFDLNGHTITYGNGPVITVPNHSFEQGTTGWDFSAAPNASVQPGTFVQPVQVADGSDSMAITLPSTTQSVVSAQPIHLPGGRYYVLSARYYNMMANGTSSTLTLALQDSGTGTILTSTSMTGTTYRGFQYFNAFYHATADTDVKISITYAGGSPGGTIYLDDVHLVIGPSYGVVVAASWAPGMYDNPAGGGGNDAVITNGTITQGAGGGFASHAVYFNQGPGNGSEISHLTSTVWGVNSVNIRADYHGGMLVHDNVLTSNVTVIQSRDQQQGSLIDIANDSTALGADLIYNNTLVGGAQCGIIVQGGPGIEVYGNDISQSAWYTNDFSVMINSPGVVVHDNYIHPVSGRGIHIEYPDAQVYNNRLVMQELKRNQEYDGAEALGTYGIQLEDYAANSQVYGNTVTVNGGDCGGACIRATNLAAGAANQIYGNTFTANGDQGTYQTVDISLDGKGAGDLTFLNNTMVADQSNIMVPYDGNVGTVIQGSTIAKGANASSTYHVLWYESAGAASGPTLLDDVFTQGADPANVRMIPIGFGGWAGSEEYFLDWTLTLTVVDKAGAPLSGAAVSIVDAQGQTVLTGTSDAHGQVLTPLTQQHCYNSATQATIVDTETPHVVTVSLNGVNATQTVTMVAPTALTMTLATTAAASSTTAGSSGAGGTAFGAGTSSGGGGSGGGSSCGLGGGAALVSLLVGVGRRRVAVSRAMRVPAVPA